MFPTSIRIIAYISSLQKIRHKLACLCIIILYEIIFSAFAVTAQVSKVDSLIHLLNQTKNDTAKVKLYNNISRELENIGNFEQAETYCSSAVDLAQKINYKRGLAFAKVWMGVIKTDRGELQSTTAYFSDALKLMQELNDSTGMADCYLSIGNYYADKGNYVETMKNYLLALEIDEKMGTNKIRIGKDYGNIANVYGFQSNYPEALKYYLLALDIFIKTDSKKGASNTYSNIGIIYRKQHNFAEALKNYNEALKIQIEINDRTGAGGTYNNIGVIYFDQLNYVKALENYYLALKTFQHLGQKYSLTLSYANIGEAYERQKKYQEARKYLTKGLELGKNIGAKDLVKSCYDMLSQLEAETGNFKSAYEYHKQFAELKDTLLNENNNKQIAEMKTKYETVKKDNQIALLNSENKVKQAEVNKQKIIKYGAFSLAVLILISSIIGLNNIRIKNKAAQAAKANDMRQKISRDLHDEIGSGLTTISMICEQAESEGEEDNKLLKLSNNVKTQAHSVNQKLRELVWATNPENDNLDAMLSSMRNYVYRYFDNSNLEYSINVPDDVSPVKLKADVSRNLMFVLKEALNNSVKHSNATNIDVFFQIYDNKKYAFRISDNGKGIDYNFLPSHHNGLNNMRKRIEDINGEIEIISEKDKGTRIEISGSFA